MANISAKQRFFNYFEKQPLETQRELLNELVIIISQPPKNRNDSLILSLNQKLDLYKRLSGSATNEAVNKRLKEIEESSKKTE